MNMRFGSLAVAACTCGLLFSGAASARQATDAITVTGAVLGPATNGTYVQFFSADGGTPFKRISLSGGGNFHFSWTSGGPCKLTPANGGIYCDFMPYYGGPAPNFTENTTISGTLPASVDGTVVYADDSTGTFVAPVGDVAPSSYIPPRTDVVVKGTSIQISVGGALPPFLQFSLSGGSDWHLTAINDTGSGSCSLTSSNGGGSCVFATPAYGFVLNATFVGPTPTRIGGQITYAHDVTMFWTFPSPAGGAWISNAVLTGLTARKPGLRFALNARGDQFSTKLKSFELRLPRGEGLRFDPKQVVNGTACHGPGKWKSSWINAKEMRCTPGVPYPWDKPSLTPVVTNLRISAMHETIFLEQRVKEHKVTKLPFYITVTGSRDEVIPLRGLGKIGN